MLVFDTYDLDAMTPLQQGHLANLLNAHKKAPGTYTAEYVREEMAKAGYKPVATTYRNENAFLAAEKKFEKSNSTEKIVFVLRD